MHLKESGGSSKNEEAGAAGVTTLLSNSAFMCVDYRARASRVCRSECAPTGDHGVIYIRPTWVQPIQNKGH